MRGAGMPSALGLAALLALNFSACWAFMPSQPVGRQHHSRRLFVGHATPRNDGDENADGLEKGMVRGKSGKIRDGRDLLPYSVIDTVRVAPSTIWTT